MIPRFLAAFALIFSTLACKRAPEPRPAEAEAALPPSRPAWDRVARSDFNPWAMKLGLPFFWKRTPGEVSDDVLEPRELAVLLRYGDEPRSHWVDEDGFTLAFREAYDRIADAAAGRLDPATGADAERIGLLHRELDQGRPTLIQWDFAEGTEAERELIRHLLEVAQLIEELHARQKGTAKEMLTLDQLDPASRAVFIRNQGPFCVAPDTEDDPSCTAIPGSERSFGLYPESLQRDPAFCEQLARRPDAESLLSPFTVVRERDGELVAVPYSEAYRDLMQPVAKHLRQAAQALDPEDEGPFIAYLEAAATAFETNDWFSADEAWAAMNAENSKWYLRVGPDEVYYEPCNRKAGFHLSFARINQDSLEWRAELEPVKQEMENQLAKMAGRPYQARDVAFHLPDFIDIILNAGNSRAPHGATIGQSLPNWGPVANQGRGRTVAMTNLYTDPDSRRILERQAASLYCEDTMRAFTPDPEALVMSIVLHEAAHNLGPSHEYEVRGKTDDEVFGGPLASTMEELKAQTSALFLADWLAGQGVITEQERDEAHLRDVAWAFGHISRGMYDAAERPRSYSQLAAIQLGYLMDGGAIVWNPDQTAANGEDTGCFSVRLEAMTDAVADLEALVLGIKARGDQERAEELKARFVDGADRQDLFETVQTRWLRAPKATFVYAIEY